MLVRPFSLLLLICALPVTVLGQPVLEEMVVRAERLPPSGSVLQERIRPSASSDTLPLLPADMLRAAPGAFVQQTTPGQGIPIVRGLKGSQVLHLVDGFRLNNALFRSAPNQYLALVPTEAVSAIDVARGPVGTAFGSDAMGGVVQLHTARPDFAQPLRLGGRVGWVGSSDAFTGALRLRAGGDDHAVDAGISGADVGDRRTGGGSTVQPSAYESRAAWISSRHRGADAEWGVNLQWAEQPSTPRVDELVPGFGQDAPAASEFYFEPNRREFAQLHGKWQLDAAWASELHAQVGWQRVIDDRRVRPFEGELRTLERNSSELAGLSITALRNLARGSTLRYGLDLYTDEVRSMRLVEPLDGGPRQPVAARFPDGARLDSVGLFAEQSWQIADATLMELGLRYSRFRIDIPAGESGEASARLEPDDLSGRLGLRQRLSEDVDFIANLAQGFRAPNIFDLGALGPRPGNRFNVASTDLDPERITSLDAGFVVTGGSLRWELTGFYAEYRDKIASVLTGDITEDGRLVTRSENLASATLYGMEAVGAWRGAGGASLSATVNWTWGEEEDTEGVAPADRIPPLNGHLRLALPFGGWYMAAVLSFATAQERLSPRDRRDPRIDPNGTGGWAALNLRARRPLGERLALTLGLENVFDARYREHGSGIDAPGRGVVVVLELPLEN